MANVSLKGVYKRYQNSDKPAVSDFNLEIADKEFVVFVGPSGCGKSTTLRMVAGLEEISEGEIYIGDTLVNNLEPKDRDIAMVFQNYALYPHMSVYNNIAFGLRYKKIPDVKRNKKTGEPVLDKQGNEIKILRHHTKREIDEKVRKAAEILEITDYLDRKPKALSGGQRQRVAIGRAIVRNPKVFLMDEPLSNLDAKLRNQMRAEILLLRKRINTTFIYVTHDQTEAMTLGDRIVIIKDGFIQQVGTPLQVFNSPANMFVAGFIGTPQMNFFDAQLVRDKGGWRADVCGFSIPVSGKLREIEGDSLDVIVGVRPEHLKIASSKQQGFDGKADIFEMMGSELHIHASADDKPFIVRAQTLSLSESDKKAVENGGTLRFTFDKSVMHIFDRESGENLSVE